MKISAASPVLHGYPVTEFTLGHMPGFEPMPVVRWDEAGTFLSRLVLDEEARRRVAETGEIYVFHGAFEGRFLPIRATPERPEYTLRVLAVSLAGAGTVVCHGLEVSEAGGTERDREDYVAAEAAALLLAARIRLPAHAALLAAHSEWMLKGGQTCATAGELEEALALRLKKALDLIEKRVEVRGADGSVYKADVVEMTPRECAEVSRAA